SYALSKERASFRVWPGPNGFAAVVQKKRKVENQRVFELLKDISIGNQLRIFGLSERVQFIDTYTCMLIGCITMTKLMMHQAGELAEFVNVMTEKIDPMHRS